MISIVIPTYKEAINIPVLFEKIDKAMNNAGLEYEIVVVDDDSKDGTDEVIGNISSKFHVKLKVRKNERDLSSAVIEGFRISSGEIIVVMDADLSHPPEKIPELVDAIKNGRSDFAIGSRFIEDGSMTKYNMFRRLNAWGAKMLARPLAKISDPMTGFFALPRGILKSDVRLDPLGFKIGLEIIVRKAPKRIAEIPIEFNERLYGKSKLSMKERIKYLIHLGRLYRHKYKQQ